VLDSEGNILKKTRYNFSSELVNCYAKSTPCTVWKNKFYC